MVPRPIHSSSGRSDRTCLEDRPGGGQSGEGRSLDTAGAEGITRQNKGWSQARHHAGRRVEDPGSAVPPPVDLKVPDARADPFPCGLDEQKTALRPVSIPMLKAECGRGVEGHRRHRGDAFCLIVRDPGQRARDWRKTAGERDARRRLIQDCHHREASIVLDGGEARSEIGRKVHSTRIEQGERLGGRWGEDHGPGRKNRASGRGRDPLGSLLTQGAQRRFREDFQTLGQMLGHGCHRWSTPPSAGDHDLRARRGWPPLGPRWPEAFPPPVIGQASTLKVETRGTMVEDRVTNPSRSQAPSDAASLVDHPHGEPGPLQFDSSQQAGDPSPDNENFRCRDGARQRTACRRRNAGCHAPSLDRGRSGATPPGPTPTPFLNLNPKPES